MSEFAAFSAAVLDTSVWISLGLLAVAFLIIVARIVIGPTMPDRVLALDMLVSVAIGFIAVIGVRSNFFLYIDVAIVLALVGFLATVAFARFIWSRGRAGDTAIADEVARDKARAAAQAAGQDASKE